MEQLRESELIHFSNGVYHGFLSDGRFKEVFGAFLWDNGDFYIGEWKKDKMHGRGILHFCGGGYIEGQFEESNISGKAQFVLPHGDIYLGIWKLGIPQTTCFCLPAGSKTYKTMIVSNGQLGQTSELADIKYINELKQSIDISGVFKKLHQSHSVDVRAAKRFARLNIVDGNTKVYLGAQRNGVPDGLGILTHCSSNNTTQFQHEWGYFHGGQLSGVGRKPIQSSSNNDYYLGQFLRGKFSGEGCMFLNAQKIVKKMYFKDGIAVAEKDKSQNGQIVSSVAQPSQPLSQASCSLDRSTLPFFNRKKIEKIVDNNCTCSFDQIHMLGISKTSDQQKSSSLAILTEVNAGVVEDLTNIETFETVEDLKENKQINKQTHTNKDNNQLLCNQEGQTLEIIKQTLQKADIPKIQVETTQKSSVEQQQQSQNHQTQNTKQSLSKNPSQHHQSNLNTLNLLYQRQLNKHKKLIKRADTEANDHVNGILEQALFDVGDIKHTVANKSIKLIKNLQNASISKNILPPDIITSSSNNNNNNNLNFVSSTDKINSSNNDLNGFPQVEPFSERISSVEQQQQHHQTRFQSQYSTQSLDPSNENQNKQSSCFSMYLSPSQRNSAADLHNNQNNNIPNSKSNGKIQQKSKLVLQEALKLQEMQKKLKSKKSIITNNVVIENVTKKQELSSKKHISSSASKLLVSNNHSSGDKRVISEQHGYQEQTAEKLPLNLGNSQQKQLQIEKFLPFQSPSEMQHYYQTRISKTQVDCSDMSKEQTKLSTWISKPSLLSKSYNKDGTAVKLSKGQQGTNANNIVQQSSKTNLTRHSQNFSSNIQLNNLISKDFNQMKSMSQKSLINFSKESQKNKQQQQLQKAKSFEIASQQDNASNNGMDAALMNEKENSPEKREVKIKRDSQSSAQSLIISHNGSYINSSADKQNEDEQILIRRSIEEKQIENNDRLSFQQDQEKKIVEEAKNSISERIKQILSIKRTASSDARNHREVNNANYNNHQPEQRQRFSLRNPKGYLNGQEQEPGYYGYCSLKKIIQNPNSSGKVSAAVSPNRNQSGFEGILNTDIIQERNSKSNPQTMKDISNQDDIEVAIEKQTKSSYDNQNIQNINQYPSRMSCNQLIDGQNNKNADLESYLLKQQNQQQQQQQQQQQLQQQENKQSRSQNQKVSSYLSFQDRLNNLGQQIYKKEWSSFKTASRDNTNVVDKTHEISEDIINCQQQENIKINTKNTGDSEDILDMIKSLSAKKIQDKISLEQCIEQIDKSDGQNEENEKGEKDQENKQPSLIAGATIANNDDALASLEKESLSESQKIQIQLKKPIECDSSLENGEKSLENLIDMIGDKEDLNLRDRVVEEGSKSPGDFFQGEKAFLEEIQELDGIEIRNFEDELLNLQKEGGHINNKNNNLDNSNSSRDTHSKEGSIIELVINQQQFNEDFLFASETVKINNDLRNPCQQQMNDFDDYQSPKYHEQQNSQQYYQQQQLSCERIIFFGENDDFQHQIEGFSPINKIDGSGNIMHFEDKIQEFELIEEGKQDRKDIQNCVFRGKYRSILESIKENALEDKCTSPKLQRPRDSEQHNEQQAKIEDIVKSLQF